MDPQRLDLVARMGYDYYCRAHGDAIFEVYKPKWNGIGIDSLPTFIRESSILTGAQLAKLAGIKEIPPKNEELKNHVMVKCSRMTELEKFYHEQPNEKDLQNMIAVLVDANLLDMAWCLLVEFGM
jgi:hypothetical protein